MFQGGVFPLMDGDKKAQYLQRSFVVLVVMFGTPFPGMSFFFFRAVISK